MKNKIWILGILILFLLNLISATTNITNCQTLSNANEDYILINSISNNTITSNCIIVSAQNITLDCNGYSITSTANVSGVYSNKFNTTIKNCNIEMGIGSNARGIQIQNYPNNTLINNILITNGSGRGVDFYLTSNNTLINNTAISNSGQGFYFHTSDNNLINNNTVISNSGQGFNMANSLNNIFINNTGISTSSVGFYFGLNSNNSIIIDNTGTSDSNYAIFIETSSNHTLINNTGIANSGRGIYILTSSNNTLINNTGIANSGRGVDFYLTSNNTLINNTAISNSGQGFNIRSSQNNIFINNTGISTSSIGFDLFNSDNNILINNIGTSNSLIGFRVYGKYNIVTDNIGTSNSSYAIRIFYSDNNTFINNIGISNLSFGYYLGDLNNNILKYIKAEGYLGVKLENSNNNLIQDCINIFGTDLDINISINSSNNTFINCSYNISKEYVESGSELIKKWYYKAYVNDSNGNAIPNTNIKAFNVSGNQEISLLTDSLGWINLTTLTDYINDGTRSYYSPYLINATNSSHIGYHYYNVSFETNNLNDFISLGIPISIIIHSPLNLSYPTKNISLDVTANQDINTWWYSNDSGQTNHTFTPNQSIIWVEGFNAIYVWANDSLGYETSDSVSFTIDTVNPVVNIFYPLSTIYGINITQLNYTAVNNGSLDVCWYSLDGGITNSTPQTCMQNWTTLTSNEGTNTWTVWANDSVGYEGFDSVTFIVDTIPPTITIHSPISTTYTTNLIDLEVTADENINQWWFNINGTNITFTPNITLSLEDGEYNLFVYANDSLGYENYANISFDIAVPEEIFRNFPQEIVLLDDPLGMYTAMRVGGIGLSMFFYYIKTTIPILLLGLAIVGILLLIGYGLSKIFKTEWILNNK